MNIQKRTALAPSSLNWEDLSKSYFYFPTCQCDTLGVYRKSAGCDHQDPRKGEEISPEQREAGPCRWSLPTKEKPKATSNSPCNGNNKAEYELNLLRERAENNSWLTSPESGASQRLVPGSDGNTTKTAPAVSGDCRGRENQQLFETLSSDAQVQPRLPNPTFFPSPHDLIVISTPAVPIFCLPMGINTILQLLTKLQWHPRFPGKIYLLGFSKRIAEASEEIWDKPFTQSSYLALPHC